MAKLWIRVLAFLAPPDLRERWREEWLAELTAAPQRGRRAVGAWRDLLALRGSRRRERRGPLVSSAALVDDMRFAIQQIRRHPGSSTLMVVLVAIGAGFVTALASVVYGAFLAPWPVHAPDRLAVVYRLSPSGYVGISNLLHRYSRNDWSLDDIPGVEEVAGTWGMEVNLAAGDLTERTFGEMVTTNYFDLLGVQPAQGRGFVAADDEDAEARMPMVISHRLWQRRFGADPDVLGKSVVLHGVPGTVVGVMPEPFIGFASRWGRSDWWALRSRVIPRGGLATLVRLAAGTTAQQLEAALEPFGRQEVERIQVRSPNYRLPGNARLYQVRGLPDVQVIAEPDQSVVLPRVLAALGTVVVAVMVIAMINVASLITARNQQRLSELATRRLLGVTTSRLARQLSTELVLLSTAGGVGGAWIAQLVLGVSRASMPEQVRGAGGNAGALDTGILFGSFDWTWWLVSVAGAIIAGLLAAAIPTWRALTASRTAHGNTLAATAPHGSRSRLMVAVPQLALTLLLLVVAGVHVRALGEVEFVDRGYVMDGATWLGLSRDIPDHVRERRQAPVDRAAEYQRTYRQLYDVVRTQPGISAGLMTTLPLVSTSSPDVAAADGSDPQQGGVTVDVQRVAVSPGALGAIGIRVLDGRDFDDRDTRQNRAVAVVSESVARRLWPGQRAVGQRLGAFSPAQSEPKTDWYDVVGVVNDTQPILPRDNDPDRVYTSLGQAWEPWAYHLVVAAGAAVEQIAQLRSRLDSVDPYAAVFRIEPLVASADRLLYPRRLASAVLSASGLLGLLLASVGIYGVMSFSVSRRLRELGIRAALGARPEDLVRLVLREGGRILFVACIVGIGAAIATLRATAHLTEGLPTFDWVAFAVIPTLLATVVILAVLGPARRAGGADPISTLKA